MSSRDRSILAVVVLIVVAVAGYFIVVKPEHTKANQVQAQIVATQTSLSQAESSVRQGLMYERQYRTYERQLEVVSTAVPADAQVPTLIDELQTAATKSTVGFQTVSSAGTAAAAATTTPAMTTGTTLASFPSQAFSLSLTGTYFAVANLLGRLASFVHSDDKHFKASGRLLSITSVSLSPGLATPTTIPAKPGDVTASISLSDYDIPTALLTSSTAATAGTSPTA